MDIDTGDTVLHKPTGEEWLVAGVKGDRLMWCGWPQGTASLNDCDLVAKAMPEARDKLLREMAAMPGSDMRKTYAMQRLGHNARSEARPACGTSRSTEELDG